VDLKTRARGVEQAGSSEQSSGTAMLLLFGTATE
jgi:hypothetical protein